MVEKRVKKHRIPPQRTEVRLDESSFYSPGSEGLGSSKTFYFDALPSKRYYIKMRGTRYSEVSEEAAFPEIQKLSRTN
jgi:hypothetical protein